MGDVKHHVTLRASREPAQVYLGCECGWAAQLPDVGTPVEALAAAEAHLADATGASPQEPAWYFTFGVGYDLSDSYVVVRAPTEYLARVRFLDERADVMPQPGRGWASVYSELQFRQVNARYGPFREVPVTTPAVPHAEVDG